MWKIMCFLNLKPHKHIALHQIVRYMTPLNNNKKKFILVRYYMIFIYYIQIAISQQFFYI